MPQHTFDRLQLAVEQLDLAIELFLSHRSDVAALTLAGAAEEILGKAVNRIGGQSALEQTHETLALTSRILRGVELKYNSVADEENYARNSVKHLREGEDATVTTDIHRAAQSMIVRACTNYGRLDLPWTDPIKSFDDWFLEHEVGV